MKNSLYLIAIMAVSLLVGALSGCGSQPTTDRNIQQRQESMQADAESSAGLPTIKNWTELKEVNMIYELRDNPNYVTYTYLENTVPTPVKGHTVLGGKLVFLGQSIGYGLPYGTQRSNPEKVTQLFSGGSFYTLPQAEPNGLFIPPTAEGTWILLLDPAPGGKDVKPIYVESRVTVMPFKLPFD